MKTLKDAIYGLAIGDALGVPVEFVSREILCRNPVTDMVGYGTHGQIEGTWSDDTSLSLALCDSLRENGALKCSDVMRKFKEWYSEDKYTARGTLFDIGNTTANAILKWDGENPYCGGVGMYDNGNGSLMRIIPLAFWDVTISDIHDVSRLTHGNEVSLIACGIYLNVARALIRDDTVKSGLNQAFSVYNSFGYEYNESLVKHFHRLPYIQELDEIDIKSSGFVVDTLEAALWCLLTTGNYKDCVLRAVNLGEDTDTVAAVAGGLAGIKYGIENIPNEWINKLANKELIDSCLF